MSSRNTHFFLKFNRKRIERRGEIGAVSLLFMWVLFNRAWKPFGIQMVTKLNEMGERKHD